MRRKQQEPERNECRHLKKSSKTNTYNILRQLTGLAPQQQLLVLGMTMVSCWQAAIREIIYILQFLNSSILFAFVWTFCWIMFMLLMFIGLSFFNWMVFKFISTFFICRQKPCRLLKKNTFYESLKRPAAVATFEHLDCRSKSIVSTNLKAIKKIDTTNMYWVFKDISFIHLFQRFHF